MIVEVCTASCYRVLAQTMELTSFSLGRIKTTLSWVSRITMGALYLCHEKVVTEEGSLDQCYFLTHQLCFDPPTQNDFSAHFYFPYIIEL